MTDRRWILASASPRRRAMFSARGIPCELADPGDAEEGVGRGTCTDVAIAKARAKARVVAAGLGAGPPALVIGADTIAELDGQPIGKPVDRADARRILARLSGTCHSVVTAVALAWVPEGREHAFAETSAIWMRALAASEIAAYVDSGEADGKAGAYAIQETGDRFVERIAGDIDTVVGFPFTRFLAELERLGEPVPRGLG